MKIRRTPLPVTLLLLAAFSWNDAGAEGYSTDHGAEVARSLSDGCPNDLVRDGHAHYHCHDDFTHADVVEFESRRRGAVSPPKDAHTLVFRGADHGERKQVLDLSNGLRLRWGVRRIDGVQVREALGLDPWRRGRERVQAVKLRLHRGEREVHVKIDSADHAVDLTLSRYTTIYGPEAWDGRFAVAEDVSTDVNDAGTFSALHALLVGAEGSRLVLDRPARLILDGNTDVPHFAAHARATEWHALEPCDDTANEKEPGGLTFPDACYVRGADHVVIWTHHFTVYATPCAGTLNPPDPGATPAPLHVNTCMQVLPSDDPYIFENVNIVEGGELRFQDGDGGKIDFRAKSILVERAGKLVAGTPSSPFGRPTSASGQGTQLLIGLWGTDPTSGGTIQTQNALGIKCVGTGGCYDPSRIGKICDGTDPADPCQTEPLANHSTDNAYFEGYDVNGLPHDGQGNIFGHKVLAVSYGGSLQLYGYKGVPTAEMYVDQSPGDCDVPPAANHNDVQSWADLSGNSWARVSTGEKGATTLTVDRPVNWTKGDKVVVGTNDWHVSHSEVVTVDDSSSDNGVLTLLEDPSAPYGEAEALKYGHSGSIIYKTDSGSDNQQIEGRAVAGLLTRSIVIRSLGDTANDTELKPASQCKFDNGELPSQDCFFGGHTLVRQGFADFEVSGVEFYQLGQGGRMAHYPIHFHLAKDTSYTDAFVKDSSVWDSMTRFITVHATHGVELTRNVGYLSVGHGYYLEDASEIDNKFCHNLSVSTRPSYEEYFEKQAPGSRSQRAIPPILTFLADMTLQGSDGMFPTGFWIMNAYNDFVGNAVVGVGGFGACYWPVSSGVSGMSRAGTMHWAKQHNNPDDDGYQQRSPLDYANFNVAGGRQAPFKRFIGNSCQTATLGVMTERLSVSPNIQIFVNWALLNKPGLNFDKVAPTPLNWEFTPIINPYYTETNSSILDPLPFHMDAGGAWVTDWSQKTMLPRALSNFMAMTHAKGEDANPICAAGGTNVDALILNNAKYCVTTVLDRFSTRFNWPQRDLGSVWLRPFNYLVINSVIADQLGGGLGFVSGGSWDQALPGYIAMAKDTLFVGTTSNVADAQSGPTLVAGQCNPFICTNHADGTGLFSGGFNPKRLLTIYDGPVFSDGNLFGGVQDWTCKALACGIYLTQTNMMDDGDDWAIDSKVRVPDAAIGWKQPNGFFYPPAFAFKRSVFEDTTTRHNVLDPASGYFNGSPTLGNPVPLLLQGASTSIDPVPNGNTAWSGGAVTPVDFMTILNDLDGSLNGRIPSDDSSQRTSGLSNNFFYQVPSEEPECNSIGTTTVPHDFVSTVVGRLDGMPRSGGAKFDLWMKADKPSHRPMIPIYRQLTLDGVAGEGCDGSDGVSAVCGTTKPAGIDMSAYWGCRRGSFLLGTDTGQAPQLTINNGIYYVETLPQQVECVKDALPVPSNPNAGEYRVSKFEADKTYALYNLFAKKDTSVTYQVYVGLGHSTPAADVVEFIRVHPHDSDRVVTSWTEGTPTAVDVTWADPDKTVVQVVLHTSGIADEFNFQGEVGKSCQPNDICRLSSDGHGCEVSDAYADSSIAGALCEVCADWVQLRESEAEGIFLGDCPSGGCPGFSFTMGALPADGTDNSYATVGHTLTTAYDTSTAPWDRTLAPLNPPDPNCE